MVVLVALAGCTGSIPGMSDGDSTDPIEYVPGGSEVVVHVDMAVANDGETNTLFEAMAQEDPETEDVEDAKAEFENETGLNPERVSDVVFFSVPADSDEEFAVNDDAAIAYTNWNEDDVVGALEEEHEVEYEETEQDGVTVYEPQVDEDEMMWSEPPSIAVLESGTYAFGDANAVNQSIAVAAGDADGLDGEMRNTFKSMNGGYVTMVVDMSGEEIPEEGYAGEQIDMSVYNDVSVVGASYGTGSGTVNVDMVLQADSEDAASRIADATDGAISMVRGTATDEDVRGQLENIEVEQNGDTVEVSYQGDVDTLVELFEQFQQDPFGADPISISASGGTGASTAVAAP